MKREDIGLILALIGCIMTFFQPIVFAGQSIMCLGLGIVLGTGASD